MSIEAIADGPSTLMLDGKELKLRPFTIGAVEVAKKIGLTMFDEDDGDDQDDSAFMKQVAGFLWMQSTEPRELLKHIKNDTFEDEIECFSLHVPVQIMPQVMRQIADISELAQQGAVDVEAKDSEVDSDAPGN